MSALSQTRHVLMILAAALVVTGTLASPARAAIGAMRFSVRPTPTGSLSPGGDYFVLKTAPGEVVEDALEISNPTSRPVQVRLAPVDATTAQMGGVDYTPSDSVPQAAGAWIDLARTSVDVAPGDAEVVPFSVSIPKDAPPGINLGGIAAWTPPSGAEGPDADGVAATVEIQTRRVVAVQVELPGSAAPHLEIGGVKAIARPDGIYLQVDITNTGHGFAAGEGTLELPGESFSSVFPLDKVVPGTQVGYPIKWRAAAPADGAYPVSVEIDYGDATAEYDGEVVVGAEVRTGLADRGIGGEASRSRSLLLPLGGLAVVGAAGIAAVLHRRRRRSRTESRPAPATRAPAAPATATPSGPTAPPPPPSPRPTASPPPPPPPLVDAAPRR